MKEDLIDKESQPIEAFNVDLKDFDNFKENKCPIDLKTNEYVKLKYQIGKVSKKKFDKSILSPLININAFAIFISFVYSFSFYILLLTYILSLNKTILLYLIIIYLLGSFIQVIVIPEPVYYKSKSDFENDIKRILNSYILFKITNGKNDKNATYQAKYTIDITGEINVPKNINYIKINGVQIYSKKDLNTLIDNFKKVYKSAKVEYKLICNDEEIALPTTAYLINEQGESYSINCFTTIFCILLIQWIYALYYRLAKSKKCVELFPAKLITSNFTSSPSKFTVHNNKYEISSYINNPIDNNNYEFENDFAEYERKKKEKEEREKKVKAERKEREKRRKENTHVLSSFKNGDNYKIKVKRVYDDVYLRFDAYTPKRHHWYEAELGTYDKNIKEKVVRGDKITTYYPEGYDIRIEVIRGLYSYTVSIGDDYTENFEYRYSN